MKLVILAVTVLLGLKTVVASPFPQYTDDADDPVASKPSTIEDDLGINITDYSELFSPAVDRAVHLDSVDTNKDDEIGEDNEPSLPQDETESFNFSRASTSKTETTKVNYDGFDFASGDFNRHAFISRNIQSKNDFKTAVEDFKKQCDMKFGDPEKRKSCKDKIARYKEFENKRMPYSLTVSYPSVEVVWAISNKDDCDDYYVVYTSEKWCWKAFGPRPPRGSTEGIDAKDRLDK
ncbi:hypothetical protein HDU96_002130, partial [Phlyctochytrium bullatum]